MLKLAVPIIYMLLWSEYNYRHAFQKMHENLSTLIYYLQNK